MEVQTEEQNESSHIGKRVSVADVAQAVNMSEPRLRQLIREGQLTLYRPAREREYLLLPEVQAFFGSLHQTKLRCRRLRGGEWVESVEGEEWLHIRDAAVLLSVTIVRMGGIMREWKLVRRESRVGKRHYEVRRQDIEALRDHPKRVRHQQAYRSQRNGYAKTLPTTSASERLWEGCDFWLTGPQVAAKLQITYNQVCRLRRSGRLPAERNPWFRGKRKGEVMWRFHLSWVQELMDDPEYAKERARAVRRAISIEARRWEAFARMNRTNDPTYQPAYQMCPGDVW